ncbi:MAG: chromate transporter [Kiritimatiellia bacterium]
MSTLLKIITVFFKIGLLTVGGGLAMIPVIQQEMERLGWLDARQFIDILGIAQMTPGAISVNTATFSGYRVMSSVGDGAFHVALLGAIAGTIAVCSPSLICINAAGQLLKKYRNHLCLISVFNILRPLVAGLIITASVFLIFQSVCGNAEACDFSGGFSGFAFVVAGLAFVLSVCTRLTPILIMLAGALAGVAYGFV